MIDNTIKNRQAYILFTIILIYKNHLDMKTLEFCDQLVSLEKPLTGFALSLTANKNDAKDLLQDTFLKALANQKLFRESTNMKAWTYMIMKNTFINNYRMITRRSTILDSSKDLFLLGQNNDTSNAAPDSAYREKEINQVIDKLPKELRIPFKMYMQGYKYKEIAGILGLNIGTVKSRISVTRKKLTQLLQGYR